MITDFRKTLLLVEDDDHIAHLEKLSLEKLGYFVLLARTGESAINMMNTIDNIDLVLMDINLGFGIDGIEAAAQIIAKHEVPLIFLTAHSETELLSKTEKINSYGIVIKNSGIDILNASIKTAFRLFYSGRKKNHTDNPNNNDESDNILKAIAEKTDDFIAITDTDGIITYASSSSLTVFGYSSEKMLGRHFSEFINEPDLTSAMNDFQSAIKNNYKIKDLQIQLKRNDGSLFWAEVSGSSFNSVNLNGVLVIVRDISKRKLSEESIAKSELLLKSSIESQKDTILFSIDTNYHYLYFNKAHSDAMKYAYNMDVRLGMNILDCITNEEDRIVAKQNYDRAFNGESHNNIRIYGDAHLDWYESFFNPILNDKLEIIGATGLARNITERINVNKALATSHEMLNKLSERVPGVIYQYRLYPDGHSCFPFASNGIKDIYEVSPEEVREDASKVFTRLHPDDAKRVRDLIFESARNLSHFFCEFKVLLPNQGLRWRYSDAVPELLEDNSVLWYGIIYDITDRKNTEEQLKKSREEFRNYFEMGSIGMCVTSQEKGWVEVNDKLCRMLGYSKDELRKLTWSELTHPDDLAPDVALFNRVLSGDLDNYQMDKRFIRKDGSILYTTMNVSCQRNDDGSFNHLLTSLLDITDRKHSELIRNIQFNIAEAMVTAKSLEELCATIRNELSALFDTTNFFIALYDPKTDLLSAPFDKDEKDDFPSWSCSDSLSGYVIRQKKSMLLNKNDIQNLADSGAISLIGARAESWLGVPLEHEGKVLGAIIIQSYVNNNAYTRESLEVLESIANQLTIYIEQELTKQELVKSETRYRTLFNEAPFVVWEEDLSAIKLYLDELSAKGISDINDYFDNNPHELEHCLSLIKVLAVNTTALSFYGASDSEELIKNLPRTFTKESTDVFKNELNILINHQSIFEAEFSQKTLSGELRHVFMRIFIPESEKDSFSRVIVVMLDITDRKKAQEAVSMSELRFREIWDKSFDGMRLLDKDGRIVMVNPALCSLIGKSRTDLEGQFFDIMFDPEEAQRIRESAVRRFRDNIIEPYLERQIKLWNGKELWVELSNSSIDLHDGEHFLLSIFRDITERKFAEKEIRLTNEKLAQINSQKDKFFSIIAHDLRSPFQGLLGLTEIMVEDSGSLTLRELNDISRSINKSATVLYELLVNLLEWSQMQRGSFDFAPKSLNILQIAEKNVETIRPVAAQKNISLDLDIPPNLKIYADEKMINSVIRNFLSNGVKFTNKGGNVKISAKMKNPGIIQISVSDNGTGMTEEYKNKLFKIDERIGYNGTEGEPSSGLGLLLCKEFVEKNGGTIEVETEFGKGSKFSILIPSAK